MRLTARYKDEGLGLLV